MFAIPIVIAAPVIYGLGSGFGASLVVPTAVLLALAAALGTVTLWLARRVLEPAVRLEESRRILEDAYDRARSESLRDALTGLGNHRGFQEEVERQWAMATPTTIPSRLRTFTLETSNRATDSPGNPPATESFRESPPTTAT